MATQKEIADAEAKNAAIARDAEAQAKKVATAPAENVKVVVPADAKIPESMRAEGPSPQHPSLGLPDPVTGDPEIDAAKARAAQEIPDDDDAEEYDESKPTNIGPKVGKPIKSIVRKKFFGDDQRIYIPGQLYYLQMYEGQTYPSDVLEPVDGALAKKFRQAFKKKQDEKNERRMRIQWARDELLAGIGH